MKRLLASLLITAVTTVLISCNEKPEVSFKPYSLLNGNYTLTDSTSIDEIPEQAFLMGAFPRMLQLQNEEKLDTFIHKATDLGFDQSEFDILYQATHKAFDAMRYHFIDSLTLKRFLADQHVRSLFLAPIKPSITDEINVTLDIKTSEDEGGGDIYTFTVGEIYTDPNCSATRESCDVSIEMDIQFEFKWPNPDIQSTGSVHTLLMSNVHPSVNKFRVSNLYSSFELTLDNGYIGQYDIEIPTQETALQTRSTETDKIRADFFVTYINERKNDDGTTGEIKITGLIIGSYSQTNLTTDFDANTITVNDAASYTQMELKAEVIE